MNIRLSWKIEFLNVRTIIEMLLIFLLIFITVHGLSIQSREQSSDENAGRSVAGRLLQLLVNEFRQRSFDADECQEQSPVHAVLHADRVSKSELSKIAI